MQQKRVYMITVTIPALTKSKIIWAGSTKKCKGFVQKINGSISCLEIRI